MKNFKIASLALMMLGLVSSSLMAQCDSRSCSLCGKKVCVLEVSQEKEDVPYFKVESKEICIPGINWPWECKRRCGGVRKVCVLSTDKREKTVCKYDWSVKTICTSCCKRHSLSCDTGFASLNKDPRVPFDYYAVELAAPKAVAQPKLDAVAKPAVQMASVQSRPLPVAARPVAKLPVAKQIPVARQASVKLPAGAFQAAPAKPGQVRSAKPLTFK